MKESSLARVQAEVRISYGIDEDGKQCITTNYTAEGVDDCVPNYFDGLTMFEVAKIDFLQRHKIITSRCEDD